MANKRKVNHEQILEDLKTMSPKEVAELHDCTKANIYRVTRVNNIKLGIVREKKQKAERTLITKQDIYNFCLTGGFSHGVKLNAIRGNV